MRSAGGRRVTRDPLGSALGNHQRGRIGVATGEIAACVARRDSFAFETTLSGLGYLRHIRAWRAVGYHVRLLFLSLPSVELAIERVALRVRHGGHDIPQDVIRRRFESGRRNFDTTYSDAVDDWVLFDNSDVKPIEMARSQAP